MKNQLNKKSSSQPIASQAHGSRLRQYTPNVSKGFALIASLLIMSLLALVAMAMLSLSNVTTRTSSQNSAMLEAQANARMALMIAIGELQTQLGPDKCISARGVTMAQHPAVNATVPSDSARAWWVGAASSDPTELIGSPQKPVSWLISGLNPQATSAEQIGSNPFIDREVPMFGENSISLKLANGDPLTITAGIVPIAVPGTNTITGSYAYFVDDNGMKAQLAPSHPNLLNNDLSSTRKGGTVIPGFYDVGVLDGMVDMQGVAANDYQKLPSYNSLDLIVGNGNQIALDKRMSYTTRSLGVLSDVKRGGLKKDLTIAFENRTISSISKNGGAYPNMPSYPVFDATFAQTSASEWGDYLLLDESKRGEFAEQGYIHFGMLRDYYNIKRYIRRENGQDCLAPFVMSEGGMHGNLSGFDYARGVIPPHEIGSSGALGETPTTHYEMPYGDFQTVPNRDNDESIEFIEYYKHSPVIPILGQLQYNCWVEKGPADPSGPGFGTGDPPPTEAIVLHTQMFSAHYNPFNIPLLFAGNRRTQSFTMEYMPAPVFRFRKSDVNIPSGYHHDAGGGKNGIQHLQGFTHRNESRQYYVNSVELLGPGRAMFASFEKDFDNRKTQDMIYSTNVRDVVTDSARRTYNVIGNLPPTLDWSISFQDNGCFSHGVKHRDSWTASQFMWDAYPKNLAPWYTNYLFDFDDLPDSNYNDNSRFNFNMRLRSTTEAGSSIRPLVDCNIRSLYMNKRWDAPLYEGMDFGSRMISAYEAVDSEEDTTLERVPQMSTQSDGKGFGYWGAENTSFLGYDRVVLFDIPREDLVSLGQLQHANVGRFSYEPSYIIGNSYANPRIPLNQWKTTLTDNTQTRHNIPVPYSIYDASYLVNETLWDSYTFTTIPQVADNYRDSSETAPSESYFTSLLKRDALLPNPRFIPYVPQGSAFTMANLQKVATGATGSEVGAVDYNAGHLLIDGAFNVNSTSVDAWEAFLSSTHGMPFQKFNDVGAVTGFVALGDEKVRFPRLQSTFGKEMTTGSPDENYWTGFRALEQTEVLELAEAIVVEVKERGPFLSMGEFVNRKLEDGVLGGKGALQAALDNTVNKDPLTGFDKTADNLLMPANSNQAAGFPGQLLQGDILQALSPMMTVRSDTFTIRAYGESINPATNEVEAKAWCEATVQRYPDPVLGSTSQPFLSELAQPSSPYGRKFQMVSFRWLNANEI